MLNFSDVTSFLKGLCQVLFNIFRCIVIIAVSLFVFHFFGKESLKEDSTSDEIVYSEEIEPDDLEGFISLYSLKTLEPKLYSWIEQKGKSFNYYGYGILEKGEYTFLFGLSDLFDLDFKEIVLNITILKGDSLVNEICPIATAYGFNDTTGITKEAYLTKCKPLERLSKYGVKLLDIDERMSFEDINNDGLFDFIIMYDFGGTMGDYNLMAYQKSDASGFEEKMNSTLLTFDKERNIVFSGARVGRDGSSFYGVDPITLEDVYWSEWFNWSDSVIEFRIERHDLNLKFTHELLITDEYQGSSFPWDEINVVMDSLNRLVML